MKRQDRRPSSRRQYIRQFFQKFFQHLKLTVHDYLFDEVITDMPFQMGHVTEEEIYGLYLGFFGCIAGFLKEDGIIILYSRNRGFVRPLAARNGFSVLKEYEISKKEGTYVFILNRIFNRR